MWRAVLLFSASSDFPAISRALHPVAAPRGPVAAAPVASAAGAVDAAAQLTRVVAARRGALCLRLVQARGGGRSDCGVIMLHARLCNMSGSSSKLT